MEGQFDGFVDGSSQCVYDDCVMLGHHLVRMLEIDRIRSIPSYIQLVIGRLFMQGRSFSNYFFMLILIHLATSQYYNKQMYTDLSVIVEKAIDIAFLLSKLKNNGYDTFALDHEFKDESIFKDNVSNLLVRKSSCQPSKD